MTDNVLPVPDLGDAKRGWLVARKETEAHLNNQRFPLTREWIQEFSDLLTTERAWQEQYIDLLRFGGVEQFPESRR